jgi:hypothetical protein
VIFVKVNAGLLTLLDASTKVMQEEMIKNVGKNVSNIEKYQPFSLLHDQFVLTYVTPYKGWPSTFNYNRNEESGSQASVYIYFLQ